MKKLIFPAVAALALGLASCSSDEVNPGNGGGTVNYAEGGYVRLSINMPSAKGTRATSNSENDHFEDGLASEYSVKNAQLILFEGTSEDGATFHSAYDLDANMAMDASTTQITSTLNSARRLQIKSFKYLSNKKLPRILPYRRIHLSWCCKNQTRKFNDRHDKSTD